MLVVRLPKADGSVDELTGGQVIDLIHRQRRQIHELKREIDALKSLTGGLSSWAFATKKAAQSQRAERKAAREAARKEGALRRAHAAAERAVHEAHYRVRRRRTIEVA